MLTWDRVSARLVTMNATNETTVAPAIPADVQEKIKLVSDFERAALELDWAKHGRAKTAGKRLDAQLKKLLTALLGRKPTDAEIQAYNNL